MTDTSLVRRNIKFLVAFLAFIVLALSGAGCRALATPVRYPTSIDWQSYEAGLARAKAERKPIMLLLGADWCQPCHELADKILSDPRVIEASKGFVMVHVNVDEREDLSNRYRRGGNTLPRVYFLTPDGALLKAVRQPRLCSAYSYDRRDPASLLAGMAKAKALASDPATQPDVDPHATPAALIANACTSKSTDSACIVCTNQHCCPELRECLKHPISCFCEGGPVSNALEACQKAHCTECASSK